MEAIVRATCPKCRTALRIPTRWIGQTVKCKQCGAMVRSRPKSDSDTPPPANGTKESAPLDQTVPAPNAFEFVQPKAPRDDDPFPLPEPIAPPGPNPLGSGQALPQQVPAYPYPVPPGYGPVPGYPYALPPGYPYPLPPGYPPPGAYAPPPGYAYPAPPGYPYPLPPAAPLDSQPAVVQPLPSAPRVEPIPLSNDFKTESASTPLASRRRYRRGNRISKLIWVAVCLVLAGGLVAGGIYLAKKAEEQGKNDQAGNAGGGDGKNDGTGDGSKGVAPGTPKTGPFPRRMLFIHISKYMYLNPLTAGQEGVDRTRSSANHLAFQWRIPTEQVFLLSDTASSNAQLPMKNVVTGTYERFFDTSRAQDRIVVYFGGHAIEKDGKTYLAPVEGELDDAGTLIPLEEFYGKLKDCKATQKVVIWDVCRFNPDRGNQQTGSVAMTETLANALAAAPAGVEVVTTCSPGEKALEFKSLKLESGRNAPTYAGSAFLESMKSIKAPPAGKAPTPADPIPISEWAQAVGKRVNEMAAVPTVALKQTLKLDGKPKGDLVAANPEEAPAKRFDIPSAPKGTAPLEITLLAREFNVPPLIRSDSPETSLSELPYLDSVMKVYKADVPLEDLMRDKEKYKFRIRVLEAFDLIREMWVEREDSTKGSAKIRQYMMAPINDARKKEVLDEMEFWATGIAKLELIEVELDALLSQRAGEPKRWHAHYDYARAVVKARLAFMNEYNKVLGDVRTETLPALDEKLGQDRYNLVSSETMKNKKGAEKLADESKELYNKLIAEHKGTPWAIQAKRDRSFSLGLAWRPGSGAAATADPK